jgi:hypothetical protein
MSDQARLASLIARAIVHLHFDEHAQAEKVLFDALTEFNFAQFNQPQSQSAAQEAA